MPSSDSPTKCRKQVRRHRTPVVDGSGRVFPSLTEAAVAHGQYPGNVLIYARLGRRGFRYATPEEIATLDATAE